MDTIILTQKDTRMSKAAFFKLVDQIIPINTSRRTFAESFIGVVGANGSIYLALQQFNRRNASIPTLNTALVESDNDFSPTPPTPPTLPTNAK